MLSEVITEFREDGGISKQLNYGSVVYNVIKRETQSDFCNEISSTQHIICSSSDSFQLSQLHRTAVKS